MSFKNRLKNVLSSVALLVRYEWFLIVQSLKEAWYTGGGKLFLKTKKRGEKWANYIVLF